ncbi:MAG: PilZ domain-containing protein [Geoalkalibacter sp.]|uniref:PilZ domain-containing protein n=1 Tax=Geoalkalibacter sp. TaxID=3041440 RepID=UPI002A9CD49E|nr:PilZ domain-containing protein [Thermodesulfobacteriota bacterium]
MPRTAQQADTDNPTGDRRRNLRKPLLVQRVRLDDGRRVFFGYAKNISQSGMFISTVNPRRQGEQFDVEMILPAPFEMPLSCRCEVLWVRDFRKSSNLEPGMGLGFLDLPDELVAKIGAWVEADEERSE